MRVLETTRDLAPWNHGKPPLSDVVGLLLAKLVNNHLALFIDQDVPQVDYVLPECPQPFHGPTELVLFLLPDGVSVAVVDLKHVRFSADVGQVVTLRTLQAPLEVEQALIFDLAA